MPIRIRSNLIMISPSIVADYANDAVASAGGVPAPRHPRREDRGVAVLAPRPQGAHRADQPHRAVLAAGGRDGTGQRAGAGRGFRIVPAAPDPRAQGRREGQEEGPLGPAVHP